MSSTEVFVVDCCQHWLSSGSRVGRCTGSQWLPSNGWWLAVSSCGARAHIVTLPSWFVPVYRIATCCRQGIALL